MEALLAALGLLSLVATLSAFSLVILVLLPATFVLWFAAARSLAASTRLLTTALPACCGRRPAHRRGRGARLLRRLRNPGRQAAVLGGVGRLGRAVRACHAGQHGTGWRTQCRHAHCRPELLLHERYRHRRGSGHGDRCRARGPPEHAVHLPPATARCQTIGSSRASTMNSGMSNSRARSTAPPPPRGRVGRGRRASLRGTRR